MLYYKIYCYFDDGLAANICISRMRVLSKLIFSLYQQPFDFNNFYWKIKIPAKKKRACALSLFSLLLLTSLVNTSNTILFGMKDIDARKLGSEAQQHINLAYK